MSKRLLLSLIVLVLPALACSFVGVSPSRVVGSGKVASETRQVSGFNTVELRGSADVSVTQGEAEAVVVEADDNILPLIETTVQNGRLIISTKPNTSLTTTNPVHVNVTIKSLQGLTLSGSGNVDVSSLAGQDLNIVLSGSGDITVSGAADRVAIRLPGSGNVICSGLKARSATVTLAGSGNVAVYASESLDASLLGSGTIHYDGNPAQVRKSVSGSGSIAP
jgi:hypothetical protein